MTYRSCEKLVHATRTPQFFRDRILPRSSGRSSRGSGHYNDFRDSNGQNTFPTRPCEARLARILVSTSVLFPFIRIPCVRILSVIGLLGILPCQDCWLLVLLGHRPTHTSATHSLRQSSNPIFICREMIFRSSTQPRTLLPHPVRPPIPSLPRVFLPSWLRLASATPVIYTRGHRQVNAETVT